MSNVMRMTDGGRAVLQHHPDNQTIIEYPRRLDRLAMGENRAEVLQRIGVVSNVKSMVATEQADMVAVLARFFHDDKGEAIGNVFGAVDEIVDLCHGAREQNHHVIEARRRVLELKARERVNPVDADGHKHPAVEEEAVDTPRFPDESVARNAEETWSERDENEEELLGPDCPVLVGPPDGIG